MEFVFETAYGQKATAAMARALRKTVRKKHSRRTHVFGWIVMLLAVLLTLPLGDRPFAFNGKTVVTYLVVLIILLVLLFEDSLNGYFARKRMLKGADRAKATFCENGYYSETEIGNTEWQYENIGTVAETKDYFVFVFGQNHAQVYDKNNLTGGSAEDFRAFIQDKTKKTIVSVR